MIDLNSIEYVLFDFDDTLYVHPNHIDEEDYSQKHLIANCTGDISALYTKQGYNMQMDAFITKLASMHMKMGLISCTNPAYVNNKLKWVKETYNVEMLNLCMSRTGKHKVKFILKFLKGVNCPPEKVLVVDDYWKVLYAAGNAGMKTATPIQIVNWVNEMTSQR